MREHFVLRYAVAHLQHADTAVSSPTLRDVVHVSTGFECEIHLCEGIDVRRVADSAAFFESADGGYAHRCQWSGGGLTATTQGERSDCQQSQDKNATPTDLDSLRTLRHLLLLTQRLLEIGFRRPERQQSLVVLIDDAFQGHLLLENILQKRRLLFELVHDHPKLLAFRVTLECSRVQPRSSFAE